MLRHMTRGYADTVFLAVLQRLPPSPPAPGYAAVLPETEELTATVRLLRAAKRIFRAWQQRR